MNNIFQSIQKQPFLWIVTIIFLPTLFTLFISFQQNQSLYLQQSQAQLQTITKQKQQQLISILKQIRKDISLQANLLQSTSGETLTHLKHQNIEKYLPNLDLQNYLLLDTQGNIIYNHENKDETGKNMLTGEQHNSMFAQAVRLCLTQYKAILSDLENYERIPKKLSFFACHQIQNSQGLPVAVVAIQYSFDKLAQIFETIPDNHISINLLNEDGLVLNKLDHTTLTPEPRTYISPPVTISLTEDKPLQLNLTVPDPDLHWVLQANWDENGLQVPVYSGQTGNLVIPIIFTCLVAYILLLIFRKLNQRLSSLREQLEQINTVPVNYPLYATELNKLNLCVANIAQHMNDLTLQIEKLATGAIREYLPDIHGKPGYGIQKLQQYLNQHLHNLQQIEDVTIEVQPYDLLGLQLQHIREALLKHDHWRTLQQNQQDSEQAITHACAQHITLRDMGQNILSEVSLQTNTQAGLLHIVSEQGNLEVVAHFGLKLKSNQSSPIRQNTDLLNQIGQSDHISHIENIAANFLEIETGLGSSKTVSLLLVPLYSHNKLTGVLELCSLSPYKPEYMQLMKKMRHHIADTLHIGILYRYINTLITQSNEQTRALHQAKEVAELAYRQKSKFLANISHEIRTPLNGVLGMAQIGQRMNVGPVGQQLFIQMFESGKLLLGVVNDMLDFSKIESGKLSVERSDVKLEHIIKHVAIMCGDRASAKGLFLRMESALGLPEWFKGDPLRIAQVLIKLVNYSIQLTDDGDVLFSVQSSRSRLIFSIQNNGNTLTPEEISVLFNPFEAGNHNEGTGLELTICKRLVELMSGKLQYKNTTPQGGMFIMELPLEISIPPTADALPVLTEDVEISQKIRSLSDITQYFTNIRILAAEDNIVNRMVLENMLSLEGVTLVCVENGKEALDIILRDGEAVWDIVLTDIHMPVMDGHQLAQELRKIAPTLPIIGVTAHAFDAEKERCLANGMVAHVSKPIVMSELLNVILRHARKPTQKPNNATTELPSSDFGINWQALIEQFQGRETFVNKLLHVLIQSHAETPNKLRAAIEAQNLEQLAFIAHSFAGVASQVHADAMRAFAKHVENQAKAGQQDAYHLAEELAEKVTQFVSLIQDHLNSSTT